VNSDSIACARRSRFIPVDKVADLFFLETIFLRHRLKLKAIKFIVRNYKEVSETPGWNLVLDQHPRALAAILEFQMKKEDMAK
jgi:hypothetical protein